MIGELMRLASKLVNPISEKINHRHCLKAHTEYHVLTRVSLYRFNADCMLCGNSWEEHRQMKRDPSAGRVEKVDRFAAGRGV